MLRRMAFLLVAVGLWVLAASLPADALNVRPAFYFQTNQTANANGVPFLAGGLFTAATIQVQGTGTFTVNFEFSQDNTNWQPAECFSVADRRITTASTPATASGGYRCNVVGFQAFRARTSGMSGASVTVVGVFVALGVM